MSQVINSSSEKLLKRTVSIISAAALAMVSVFGVAGSASASEMAPIIEFDGNVLNSSVVHSEIGERPVQYAVGLNPAPLSRVMTTNRSGYSFGGWSYAAGGPAVTTLQSTSHTTTRMWLYAVWNTKMNLDPNGGTAGSDSVSAVDYRFNSTLTLPTTSTFKKKGFEFAGWSSSPSSTAFVTTYRAAGDAVGNPTVYAVWKKTITFTSKGSTGAVPAPVTILEGGSGIALPTTAGTLSRPGFEFKGWRAKAGGKAIKNTTSYLPKKANVTLRAIWKRTR
jgi:uncharacterized repeat protein (TIGR02543 family)